MRKILSRGVLFMVLTLLFMSLVSGCWSRREIDKLGFVGSVAIDQAEDPKLLEVTAQFIIPKGLAQGGAMDMGGAGGGVGGSKVWLVSAKGPTVFEALFRLNTIISNYIFFGQQTSVIIGEKVARKGVKEVLDSFDRMPQLRRNIWVAITPGKAKDLLQTSPKLQEVPSITIENLFNVLGITSVSYPSNLNSFFIALSSRSTDPIAARIMVQQNKEFVPGIRGQNVGEVIRKELKLDGAALFKHDRLAGWLDGRETRGVLWVQNKVKRGTLTFPNPRGNHKFVTFEILTGKRKIHTVMKDGRLTVNLKIIIDSNLVAQTSDADILSRSLYNERENVRAFQNAMAAEVKHEIFDALAKARKYKVDVFGIGERFYDEHPQEFKKLQKNWPEVFAKAKLNVAVDVKIRRVGLISRSINAQKKVSSE